MDALGLTAGEFQHILRVCRRVLINAQTAPLDLKHFLITRLADTETFAKIAPLNDAQVVRLRDEILASAQPAGGAGLWGDGAAAEQPTAAGG